MFIKKNEIGNQISLRDRFMQDLNVELRKNNFKQIEADLRKDLSKRMKEGKLF